MEFARKIHSAVCPVCQKAFTSLALLKPIYCSKKCCISKQKDTFCVRPNGKAKKSKIEYLKKRALNVTSNVN